MKKKRPRYTGDDGPLPAETHERIQEAVRRQHGEGLLVESLFDEELSHHDAALNMLTMAGVRLEVALTLEEPQFLLIAPQLISDSAVSFACALLRVRGIAIESNTDPHAELCLRLVASELEHPGAEHLMREIGEWDAWPGNPEIGLDLARRSLDFMVSAAVVLQAELPKSAWDLFDEQIRALAKRLARSSKNWEGAESE